MAISTHTEPARPGSRRDAPCAQTAAFALLTDRPQASAGRALFPPLRLWAPVFSFAAGFALFAPSAAVLVLLFCLMMFVCALCMLRLLGVFAPRWSPRRPLKACETPPVSVIVALYKEEAVVAGLMTHLARLDYPRDRLEIILVLEDGDTATLAAARAAARRAKVRTRVLVAPPAGPRTKPRALNYALQSAHGAMIAVYDAEDAPRPDQLRAAAEAFGADDGLGVVQAPLGWYNGDRCWLTRQFALEYAAQFHALLPAYHRLGLPLPLGGTSNVFRGLMYQLHQVRARLIGAVSLSSAHGQTSKNRHV